MIHLVHSVSSFPHLSFYSRNHHSNCTPQSTRSWRTLKTNAINLVKCVSVKSKPLQRPTKSLANRWVHCQTLQSHLAVIVRLVTVFRIDLFEELHHFILAATLLTSFLPTSAAAITTVVLFNTGHFFTWNIS